MPATLSPELEERVKALQGDDAYKEGIRQALIQNPDFAAGWLRQSDYDRNLNAIKQREKDWFAKNNGEFATLQNLATEREAKIKELEERISSGGYTPEQEAAMGKEVKQLQGTVENLNKTIETLTTKFVDRETLTKEAQGVVSFLSSNMFELNDIQFDHQATFGRPFDRTARQELIDFADAENKKGNPLSLKQAYDLKYSKDIRQVEDKKIEDRVRTEERTRLNLPVSGDVAPILGPLQARSQGAQFQDKLPENAPMDAVSAAAAAALRAEGKF